MAEIAVEISRCGACGADVRDESLFCYNCGASVSVTPAAVPAPVNNSAAPTKEAGVPRPPLRSAASLRKQRRAFNRQPVKIAWEPPDGPPTMYIVTTIVLTIGALVLLVLALYLR